MTRKGPAHTVSLGLKPRLGQIAGTPLPARRRGSHSACCFRLGGTLKCCFLSISRSCKNCSVWFMAWEPGGPNDADAAAMTPRRPEHWPRGPSALFTPARRTRDKGAGRWLGKSAAVQTRFYRRDSGTLSKQNTFCWSFARRRERAEC